MTGCRQSEPGGCREWGNGLNYFTFFSELSNDIATKYLSWNMQRKHRYACSALHTQLKFGMRMENFNAFTFCLCEIFDFWPRNRPTARKPCAVYPLPHRCAYIVVFGLISKRKSCSSLPRNLKTFSNFELLLLFFFFFFFFCKLKSSFKYFFSSKFCRFCEFFTLDLKNLAIKSKCLSVTVLHMALSF